MPDFLMDSGAHGGLALQDQQICVCNILPRGCLGAQGGLEKWGREARDPAA